MIKQKLKIAIFHCSFIYSGGGERVVLEEVKGLRKKGYLVEVYAPALDKKRCYPEIIKEVDVKTFFPTFIDKLPYRNAIRMILTSLFAPLYSLKFRDFDIFIGANQPGVWIAYCIAKVLNKPYLIYLNQPNRVVYPRPIDVKYGWHTTVKDYHALYKLFQYLKPLIAFLDKISITKANQILVGGSYMVDIVQNVYSVTGINVPAGAYFQPLEKLQNKENLYYGSLSVSGRRIKKPYALITNRHDPQKRFDYVINAFGQVIKKFPKVSLVISGPFTNHSKTLLKLVKKLKLEKRIYFIGGVNESDLEKVYKNAALYCYPSPQEDFGLGPLEAGGWGVPTVAWNHAGPTVTIEDGVTGFLAAPYEIDDYADKMIRLFKNPVLRDKMGRAAWERTKNKFSWEKHIDSLEKNILTLLKIN